MECFVAYPSIYDSYIYSKIHMPKIYCINRRCCFHPLRSDDWYKFGVALFWLESFLFESPPNNDCCRVCVWKESNLCYSRCNSSIIEGHFSTFWEKHDTESTFTPFLRFFCHVPKELPFNNGKNIPPKVRRRIFWRHPILNLYFSFDIHEAFDFRRYFQCDSGALGLFLSGLVGRL